MRSLFLAGDVNGLAREHFRDPAHENSNFLLHYVVSVRSEKLYISHNNGQDQTGKDSVSFSLSDLRFPASTNAAHRCATLPYTSDCTATQLIEA